MIKVLGVSRDMGGCSFYRVRQPMKFLNSIDGLHCAVAGQGIAGPRLSDALSAADVVVFPRAGEQYILDYIAIAKEKGKKVIIDHDDDIFNVNPLSEHYFEYGGRDVRMSVDGSTEMLWKTGETYMQGVFDAEKNAERLELVRACARNADAVSVTTDRLARVFARLNNNVMVWPNCIDPDLWKPVDVVKTNTVRISWQGGSSHYSDLLEVFPALGEIFKENAALHLVICGTEFKGCTKHIPADRIEFHPWVPVDAHPYKQAGLNVDIGVIPLANNEFNPCKSPIKFLEYAALGIPVIASNIPPYSDVIDNMQTGILYNDARDFREKLLFLAGSPETRRTIGGNAREYMLENYSAPRMAHKTGNDIKNLQPTLIEVNHGNWN